MQIVYTGNINILLFRQVLMVITENRNLRNQNVFRIEYILPHI